MAQLKSGIKKKRRKITVSSLKGFRNAQASPHRLSAFNKQAQNTLNHFQRFALKMSVSVQECLENFRKLSIVKSATDDSAGIFYIHEPFHSLCKFM